MKRTGTDPVLDEEMIVQMLHTPISANNTDMIQAGAAQALLDMYDRGMTRAEFCDHASTVLALYSQCAKLWLLRNIEIANNRAPLTGEDFKVAYDGIVEVMKKQVSEVVAQIERLRACPTSEDPIH